MRITDLYDLKFSDNIKKKIRNSLIEDVISLAESQFKHNAFEKFEIKIKLERINRGRG